MYYFYLDMLKTYLERGITTKESEFSLFPVCIPHFKILKFQKVLKTIAICQLALSRIILERITFSKGNFEKWKKK